MRKGAGRSRMRSCPTQRSGLGVRRDLLPVQGSLSAKGAAIPAPSHGLRAASDAGRQLTADRRLPVGRMQSTRSRPPLTPAPPAPTVWGESGKGKCRMVTGVGGGRAAACPDPRPGPRGDRSRRRRPQLGCYQRPACPPDRCGPERARLAPERGRLARRLRRRRSSHAHAHFKLSLDDLLFKCWCVSWMLCHPRDQGSPLHLQQVYVCTRCRFTRANCNRRAAAHRRQPCGFS